MSELLRAFDQVEKDTKRIVRKDYREIAAPVKRDAERLAQDRVRRIGSKWWHMRIGLTRTVLYVVPSKKGVRNNWARTSARRPKFALLMQERAMDPALAQNEHEIVHIVEQQVEEIAHRFNHGGPHL